MKLKIKNMAMVREYLLELGFQEKSAETINIPVWDGEKYLCWFKGKKRRGAEPPSIVISEWSGTISIYCSRAYYYRNVPSILFKVLQALEINNCLKIEGEDE